MRHSAVDGDTSLVVEVPFGSGFGAAGYKEGGWGQLILRSFCVRGCLELLDLSSHHEGFLAARAVTVSNSDPSRLAWNGTRVLSLLWSLP